MGKKVIELIRVSTEAQAAADRASIPAQRAANRRTSAQYGLEIVGTIEFADVSGAAVLSSPFRLLLAGETSYKEVGRKVGVDPFNLRIIMRNPIYTGWRVYTERRDPVGAAPTRNGGRQADQPKVKRAPEDIIRVKVLNPVVSEENFQRVQHILDQKKKNHWRVRPDCQRRFTYSGFLRCAICGNLIYTHAHKPRDWYVCKSRTWPERKLREDRGLTNCNNPYMRRERLEETIDRLFSDRLTDRAFVDGLIAEYVRRCNSNDCEVQVHHVQQKHKELGFKRQRVLDTYFENVIDRAERDRRLGAIDSDLNFCEDLLAKASSSSPRLSAEDLAQILEPFQEWEFLTRTDKRQLLQAVVPEIHIRDHEVVGLSLMPEFHHNEMTHRGRDSWPPRA